MSEVSLSLKELGLLTSPGRWGKGKYQKLYLFFGNGVGLRGPDSPEGGGEREGIDKGSEGKKELRGKKTRGVWTRRFGGYCSKFWRAAVLKNMKREGSSIFPSTWNFCSFTSLPRALPRCLESKMDYLGDL